MLTPLDKYNLDLAREDFQTDPEQKKAVMQLQALFEALVKRNSGGQRLFKAVKQLLRGESNNDIKGLYFWGGVGRGKTYLVDCFFNCLPLENKMRMHFHRFMQTIHKELKQLNDIENPLHVVADKLARETCVICFDEFHVSDITDAMLLAGLLDALFSRGVILVATSNQHPDELYKDGLQRDRFLPAISLLKEHTQIVNIDSGVDYRLMFLDQAEIYHVPLDEKANAMLENNFFHVSPDSGEDNLILEIEGRDIKTVKCGDGVVWFDFKALCDGPRGPADYIEIARQFQTVLISGIPVMGEMENDMAKRFVTLVDEFYDRNVKLIITAEAEPEGLYDGKRLAEQFQRTISRLEEMRTHDYLAKQHLP